jgi:hypothetical protein
MESELVSVIHPADLKAVIRIRSQQGKPASPKAATTWEGFWNLVEVANELTLCDILRKLPTRLPADSQLFQAAMHIALTCSRRTGPSIMGGRT